MSTGALVPSDSTAAVFQRVSDPIAFAKEMADSVSALVGCNQMQGKAVALTCLCEGLTPIEFVRRYHLVNGKPAMRADAMLAEYRLNHGGSHRVVTRTADESTIVFTDAKGAEHTATLKFSELLDAPFIYTKEHGPGSDITKPGVLKDNWAYAYGRRAMLHARNVSETLRAICPELVAGVYTPEELQDVTGGEVAAAPKQPTKTADQYLAEANWEPPAAVTSAAPPTVAVEEDVIDVEPEPSTDPSEPGSIPARMVDKIGELFDQLGLTPEKRTELLAKRGCKVVRNLSQQQAETLIDKLVAIRGEQTAGN